MPRRCNQTQPVNPPLEATRQLLQCSQVVSPVRFNFPRSPPATSLRIIYDDFEEYLAIHMIRRHVRQRLRGTRLKFADRANSRVGMGDLPHLVGLSGGGGVSENCHTLDRVDVGCGKFVGCRCQCARDHVKLLFLRHQGCLTKGRRNSPRMRMQAKLM